MKVNEFWFYFYRSFIFSLSFILIHNYYFRPDQSTIRSHYSIFTSMNFIISLMSCDIWLLIAMTVESALKGVPYMDNEYLVLLTVDHFELVDDNKPERVAHTFVVLYGCPLLSYVQFHCPPIDPFSNVSPSIYALQYHDEQMHILCIGICQCCMMPIRRLYWYICFERFMKWIKKKEMF